MPDSFKHAVPVAGMGQPNNATCWHAAYRMMMVHEKRSVNEIDDRLRAAGIDIADAKANGLSDKQYRKAATALGLTSWAGAPFNQKQGFFDVGLSDGAEAFLEELKEGPLWVSRKSGSNYHIVVAVGYDDDESRIIYHNPYPGPAHAIETQLKANIFVRGITGARGSVQGFRPWCPTD